MGPPKLTPIQELGSDQRHLTEVGRQAGKGRKPKVEDGVHEVT